MLLDFCLSFNIKTHKARTVTQTFNTENKLGIKNKTLNKKTLFFKLLYWHWNKYRHEKIPIFKIIF